MRTFTVKELKSNFSKALKIVRAGEEVAITFGYKKEIVAFLVPCAAAKTSKRPLGLLEGTAKVSFSDDFKMTEMEVLGI